MSPQSAPFDNPETVPDRTKMVKADPHQPDFWVIPSYNFYQHGTLESALAEKARLAAQFPQKGFYVLHCKRRLTKGDAKAVIANLREVNAELLDGCNALLGLCTLLLARDDLPAEVRDALQNSHRVKEAQAAIAKATGAK